MLSISNHVINYNAIIKYARKLKYKDIEKLLIKKSNLPPTHQ